MKLKPMTLKEYHNMEQPSPSLLSRAYEGVPDLVCYIKDDNEPTDEQNIGAFIHDWIENKGQMPEYWVRKQEFYQRKSGLNEAGDPKLDKRGNPIFSYENTSEPERSIMPAKSARVEQIIESLSSSSLIKELFTHELEIEPSYLININGKDIRTRPDIIDKTDKCVIEIKTAAKWRPKDFAMQFFDLNYDLQSYIELAAAKNNDGCEFIRVLAIGTGRPTGICSYDIYPEDAHIKIGEQKTLKALKNWNEYKSGRTADFYEAASQELPLSYRATDYKITNNIGD